MENQPRWPGALEPRYRLVEEIGRGGMAVVYLAEDDAGERVAVKVLAPELASALGPARFQREIRIAGELRHPHILSVLDSGEADGSLFYVMPHVDGPSLRQRLESEGALPVSDAMGIVGQIADALDYAHAEGVVHRDVKPENILLEGDRAYLADFGVARLFETDDDRVTATGHSVGTAAYSSPEQAGGDVRIDARSDVYSLACVTYEMFAGEPPFTGPNPQAVIARHIAQTPPKLDVIRPDLPPSVVAAVARGLAKSPADRFASAGSFSRALRAPRPVSTPGERRRRWLKTAAVVAALGGAGLVGLGLLGPDGPSLDPNKVVVLPLATTSGVEADDAGWGVALAIGAALEHTEPLKFIDGWTWLSQEQRASPQSLTVDEARGLARDRGAAFFTAGVIRRISDSLSVTLRLHDVAADSLVGQETVTATLEAGSVGHLGMRAVLGLLPRLVDPTHVVDLTPLMDRSPAATALFLQGERAYRQSRFTDALELYRRAVEEDSLHVFAAIKGAQAASWGSDFNQARDLIGRAVERLELLPDKYGYLATGLEAYLRGDAMGATGDFREALALDEEWPEALSAMGEVYVHLLPDDAVSPDSTARYWLERSWSRDSTFAPPIFHLTEIALRAGAVQRAGELIGRWSRFEPDTVFLRQVRHSLDCLRSGEPRDFDWGAHVGETGRAVLQAAISLGGGASQVPCARGAYEAILDSALPRSLRWTALMGLSGLAVAGGRYQEADSLLRVHQDTDLSAARILWIHFSLAGAPFGDEASRAEKILWRAGGDTYDGLPARWRWIAGVWHARQGRPERVAAIAGAMERTAEETDDRETRLLSRALRGHAAAARGDREAAIEILAALRPNAPRALLTFRESEALGPERLLLSELLLAEGRPEEAYRTAALLDHPNPIIYLSYLPGSLAVRAEAARRMERTTLSRRIEIRLDSLGWTDRPGIRLPDP